MDRSTTTRAESSMISEPPATPEVGAATFYSSVRENLHWLKEAVAHHSAGAGPQGPAGPKGPAGTFLAAWRGAWMAGATYARGDIVNWADEAGPAVWVAVGKPSVGSVPQEPAWSVVLRVPAQA
ncbi:hypothetical protein ACIGXM_14325 [Kitasatospora sp. NPDC052896]|uniref:hypothetical protein n=1 Tax=Kitasatospora sp. NPDC052896 TaxID=3364061 RepID=UPI0037CA5A85